MKPPVPVERKNFICSAFGRKGSGKSHLLNKYRARFPKVISYDPMGQRAEEEHAAIVGYSAAEVIDILAEVASLPSFHVVAFIDPDDVVKLARVLAPADMGRNQGYSRAVHGVCFELPEVDTLAPNGRTSREIRSMWQRGRHYRLSLLCDTQRPSLTDRLVTSQSDVVIAFAQHEPRDVKYFAETLSHPLAEIIKHDLDEYEHLRYFPGRSVGQVVDRDGNVKYNVRPDGTTSTHTPARGVPVITA